MMATVVLRGQKVYDGHDFVAFFKMLSPAGHGP